MEQPAHVFQCAACANCKHINFWDSGWPTSCAHCHEPFVRVRRPYERALTKFYWRLGRFDYDRTWGFSVTFLRTTIGWTWHGGWNFTRHERWGWA
jgi:hypothetical protein